MKKKFQGRWITFRRYKPADFPETVALWEAAGLPYKPKGRDVSKKIAREIEREGTLFLVATVNSEIIGTILGSHDGRKGWINRLATHPDFRNLGIAKNLVEMVEEFFERNGIEIIACLIEDYNRDSMEFFERRGYIRQPDIFYYTKKKHPGV